MITTFAAAFAAEATQMAAHDSRIIAVTAAMPDGTGLKEFAKAFPARFFDVGIAEAHATCFAAGAAAAGLRPLVAIYSTFLQRAYDQIVHDVSVQSLPVTFCIDRAGLVGDDGKTHQGAYDIAYLRTLPNVAIMAPSTETELRMMLRYGHALHDGKTDDRAHHEGPVAIRYPRGASALRDDRPEPEPLRFGKSQVLQTGDPNGIAVLAAGICVDAALAAAAALRLEGIDLTIVNARFVRPVDKDVIDELGRTRSALITVEEHSVAGGYGSAVLETLADLGRSIRVVRLGIPQTFVGHATQPAQRKECGLDEAGIVRAVRSILGRAPAQVAQVRPLQQ